MSDLHSGDVREWWAANPMTYGSTHGTAAYEDGTYEPGSLAFFDRLDREFFSWNRNLHGAAPFDRLFPYGAYRNGGKVLEVGCGLGTMAECWARQGADVTAIDLNPTAVRLTRRRFDLRALRGVTSLADARALPFEPHAFDYVYSWGVLHHSPDLPRSIEDVMRVLRPGGGYGIMLYNRNSALYRYQVEYLQGFLHLESRFLGSLELASRYGDGDAQEGNPHTWPITKREAIDLMRPYSRDVQVRVLGTDLDSIFRRMLPLVGRSLPLVVRKAWARRIGWSLWIHGHRDGG